MEVVLLSSHNFHLFLSVSDYEVSKANKRSKVFSSNENFIIFMSREECGYLWSVVKQLGSPLG